MGKSIALLLQRHFIEYCREEIGDVCQDCRLTYFEYESLEELRRIFLDVKGQYDGFLTSGGLPLNVIRNADEPPFSVTGCFGGYLENTYRMLLARALKRGSVDSRRIGIDYVEPGENLGDVLEADRLPVLVRDFERKMSQLSTGELALLEEDIVEKYKTRCREGKLDLVVTYFHSAVEALKDEDVECCYSYPSRQSLRESIELCKKNICLEMSRRNMAAVVRVSPKPEFWAGGNSAGRELETLSLKSALLEYCRVYNADPVFKDDLGDVEMYLTLEQVQAMTAGYSLFELPLLLKKRVQFDGWVSLGVGEDLSRARFRALQARDYEQKMVQSASILINEQDQVLALPSRQKNLGDSGSPSNGVPSGFVERVANQAHLSSETVFRVIDALRTAKTDELTAQDLVRIQNFSLRVATRVLSALAAAGYAKLTCQKRLGNKGRPKNVYQLTFFGKYGENEETVKSFDKTKN